MDHKQQILEWLEKLRAGTLAENDLRQALEGLNGQSQEGKRQRLLYLQTQKSGVDAEVLGISLVEDGEVLEGPDDPEDWPFGSVLEAMNDGWRVIKFPDMALLLQESETYSLGCEFILEKWE